MQGNLWKSVLLRSPEFHLALYTGMHRYPGHRPARDESARFLPMPLDQNLTVSQLPFEALQRCHRRWPCWILQDIQNIPFPVEIHSILFH